MLCDRKKSIISWCMKRHTFLLHMLFSTKYVSLPFRKYAYIRCQDIKRHDQGVYRCRVDFRTSQTQSFRYNLTIISKCVWMCSIWYLCAIRQTAAQRHKASYLKCNFRANGTQDGAWHSVAQGPGDNPVRFKSPTHTTHIGRGGKMIWLANRRGK